MSDPELFELCKEVNNRTEWDDNDLEDWEWKLNEAGQFVPRYTSDYLLEKLPKHLESQEKLNVTYFDEIHETGEVCWRAEYTHLFADGTWEIRWEYQGSGDTPLKALLKLTLALDDAGVKL